MLPPAVVVRVVIVGAVAKPILSVPVALLVNVPLPLKAVFTVVVPLLVIAPVLVMEIVGETNV